MCRATAELAEMPESIPALGAPAGECAAPPALWPPLAPGKTDSTSSCNVPFPIAMRGSSTAALALGGGALGSIPAAEAFASATFCSSVIVGTFANPLTATACCCRSFVTSRLTASVSAPALTACWGVSLVDAILTSVLV
eukprot:9503815-Pyramimonas_sp.AAC.1